MKKNFFILAALAAMPMAFTACSSSDDDSTTNFVITPTRTEFADEAKQLKFGDGILLPDYSVINSIELKESGRYLIRVSGAPLEVKSRADVDDDYEYLTGFYHILVKGESYRLDGFGDLTLKVNGSVIDITIKLDNGHEITVEASPQDIVQGVAGSQGSRNLCQYWKVTKSRLRLENKKGLKLARDFDGCNLREIKQYIESNSDCRIKETFETKSQLTHISFSKFQSFQLDYTDGIDVGTWNWVKESDGTLHYTWEGHEMGNSFDAGNGIVVFKSNKSCWLTIDAVIDTDGTDYNTTLTYMLEVE